jgi:hypothetical protein
MKKAFQFIDKRFELEIGTDSRPRAIFTGSWDRLA